MAIVVKNKDDFVSLLMLNVLQWNPSIPDTLGTASSVLIKGGVLILFQE